MHTDTHRHMPAQTHADTDIHRLTDTRRHTGKAFRVLAFGTVTQFDPEILV